MSYEEKAAKIKAEKQKFYDDLLAKILALPKLQEDIAEMRKDTEWNKQWRKTEYDFEEEVLDNFMGTNEDALTVPEIWDMVKEEIREEADYVTSDSKTFLKEGLDFNAENKMNEKLEEIDRELNETLKRKHGKTK